MANIVKMEDIINIVGIQNYMDALDLDITNLNDVGTELAGNKHVLFNFQYVTKKGKQTITLKVDKEKSIKEMKCDCKDFNSDDFCSHIALSIMYLLSNEEILKKGLSILNNHYDEDFNQYLFSKLLPERKKKQLRMEIVLRPSSYYSNYEYELVVKIGEKKLYVLKKQLEEFLQNYPNGDREINFGKSFVYRSSEYFFAKEDEEIIEFLKFYVDSQADTRTYYGYYERNKITSVELSGKTLKEFLKLLEKHPFKVEMGYYPKTISKIRTDYQVKTKIDEIGEELRVAFQYDDIVPLTEDYQYFMTESACYHVSKEIGDFLRIIIGNNRQQLLFKKEEYGKFSNAILPKIYELDSNLTMSEEVKKQFVVERPTVKYYFEKRRNKIKAEINLCSNGHEWNMLEEPPFYVMRSPELEEQYQEELYFYHFTLNDKDHSFELLDEDDFIEFIEEGLPELTKKYEVYVSKALKDIRVIKQTSIQSQFGIGSDNILSYQFDIDGINKKEIGSLLDAVRLKKKYYRLKNGNYMNLETNSDLQKVNQLVEELDISNKQLTQDTISISKYKSLQVERLVNEENMDFVKLEDTFEDLIQKFNQYKKNKISLSKDDLKILRDYQEVGVKWLMTISNCGFGGILADEMGLGKSIQTIMYIKLKLKKNPKAKFLIVVPTSLIYNWENEFQKFEKNISVGLMNGTKEKRVEHFKTWDQHQVLVTSYGLLRQDLEEYQKIHFDTCIIDEAQNIKNLNAEVSKSCKMINADVKFALTGTPIENSVLELFSIFDFIMPGYLPNLSKFKRTYSVKQIEENPECLHQLNEQIAPFILRRKKSDVLKDLPAKLENQVLVELDENEKKLYVGWLEKTKEQIEETIQNEGFLKSQILILSLLTKLRQICIDSRLLIENETRVGSKIKTLLEILRGSISNGHKILVFSQFPSALHLVRQELDNENISYFYLDGSTPAKRRIEMADAFNQDETKVFLISLRAGGTGLNLTSADIVVHLDPWWNPQVENQATDRSHRIGQKNVVEVIKLVTKGTIEEKIIELQNKKKNLSDQVVEGEDRDQIIISKLTEKELRNLLES